MASKQRKPSGSTGSGRRRAPPLHDQEGVEKTPFQCLGCENGIFEKEMIVECRGCREWCHEKCTKLSAAECEVIARGGSAIQWFCHKCSEDSDAGKTRMEAKLDLILGLVHSLTERDGAELFS